MQGKNTLWGEALSAIWRGLKWLSYVPRLPFLFLIKVYQKTFSPDHGLLRFLFPHGYCKFTPSCSQYGYMAVKKYGVIIGSIKAAWRVIRCNPWSSGGIDLP
ncbi:membrane protein insertion efficiency factor YidD [Candidatus Peregrinibacteria bacterium]|nr:membrane protein insertion efficiency factor YidD [Candidatus Peregrinibacteria bacterium]